MNNFNVEIPFRLISNLIHDVELYMDNNEEIDELTKLNIKSDIQPIKNLLEPITNPEPIDLEEFKKTVDLEEFKKSVGSKEQKEWFENEINKFENEELVKKQAMKDILSNKKMLEVLKMIGDD